MAGTVTVTMEKPHGKWRRVEFAWTADSGDGSVPDTPIDIQGRLIKIITNPGSPAPTDNYDITLEDENGIDQLQGVGANRDTTTTQEALITYSNTDLHPIVVSENKMDLKLANNSVNSAQGVITLVYEPA